MNGPKWFRPHEIFFYAFFFLPVTSEVAFSVHPKVSHSTMGQFFVFLLLLIIHLFVYLFPFWENFTAGIYCGNQEHELEVQCVMVPFRPVIVWK